MKGIKVNIVAMLVLMTLLATFLVLSIFYGSPERIVKKYHDLVYYSQETWAKNRWLGVYAQQNPNDAWIIQEIISDKTRLHN